MTQTGTQILADFLLARIAEDERAVRYASVNARRPSVGLDTDGYVVVDLARFLAECEAKRRIVAECVECMSRPDDDPSCDGLAAYVLSLLGLPYTSHPDYREEWKP